MTQPTSYGGRPLTPAPGAPTPELLVARFRPHARRLAWSALVLIAVAAACGYFYGNLPMPTVRVGERTRWYIMASTNFEMHAPHWHGNVVELHRMRTDVASITPMEMVVADMVPDNPGVWLFHCHLGNHLLMGMQGRYEVKPAAVAAK